MATPTLNLTPAQAGYSNAPDANTRYAKLGGGPGRFRLDHIGTAVTVNVTWRCTRLQHDYLEAFFATVVPGSQPFQVEMIIGYADPDLFTARLIPGTLRLSGVQGNLRVVDAQLEAKPIRRDAVADQALIDAYGAYGDNIVPMFKRLEKFANMDVLAIKAPQ